MDISAIIVCMSIIVTIKADDLPSSTFELFEGTPFPFNNTVDYEMLDPKNGNLKELIETYKKVQGKQLSAQFAYSVGAPVAAMASPAATYEPIELIEPDATSFMPDSFPSPIYNPSITPDASSYNPSSIYNPSITPDESSYNPSSVYNPSVTPDASSYNPSAIYSPSATVDNNPPSSFPSSPPSGIGRAGVYNPNDDFDDDVDDDPVVQRRLKLLCAITREKLKMKDLPEQRKQKMRRRLRNRCSQFAEESVKDVEAQNRADKLMRGK